MKIEFIEKEGAWIIEFTTNSDFNLHLERASGTDDVYVYRRGSSEGEYKLYKKLYGRVIDQDIDIADNIVPKYFKVKSTTQPILCEITGDVKDVTGVEVKPVDGKNMVYFDSRFISLLGLDGKNYNAYNRLQELMPEIFRGYTDGNAFTINLAEYLVSVMDRDNNYKYQMIAVALDLNKEFYVHEANTNTSERLEQCLNNLETPLTIDEVIEQYGITEEEFFAISYY